MHRHTCVLVSHQLKLLSNAFLSDLAAMFTASIYIFREAFRNLAPKRHMLVPAWPTLDAGFHQWPQGCPETCTWRVRAVGAQPFLMHRLWGVVGSQKQLSSTKRRHKGSYCPENGTLQCQLQFVLHARRTPWFDATFWFLSLFLKRSPDRKQQKFWLLNYTNSSFPLLTNYQLPRLQLALCFCTCDDLIVILLCSS